MERFALGPHRGGKWTVWVAAALLAAGCSDDDNNTADGTTIIGGGSSSGNAGGTSSTGNGASNGAPSISGKPRANVSPGEAYYFAPTVRDADGDELSFVIYNRPDWMTFDAASGALSGIPALQDAGHYPNVIIRVSDGKVSTSLSPFSVDVLPSDTTSAFLTWIPPTEYEDGSPLFDLAGYRVRYGVDSGSYTGLVEIADPYTTVLGLDFLPVDTYYFVITAFSYAGAESDFSNEETIALN